MRYRSWWGFSSTSEIAPARPALSASDWILLAGIAIFPLSCLFADFGEILVWRRGQHLMISLVLMLSCAFIIKNWWIRIFTAYLAVWLLFAQAFALYANLPIYVWAAGEIRSEVGYYFMAIIFISLVIWKKNVPVRYFMNAACVMAVIQILIAVPQHFGIYPEFEFLKLIIPNSTNPVPAVYGTMENQNFYLGMLAICLPLFFRPGWRWFVPLIAWHMLTASTSTAVVAAAVAVIVYFRQWGVAIIAFGVALQFAVLDKVMESSRFGLWRLALENYNVNWFGVSFGHGLGAPWGQPYPLHNDWLQALYELGSVGIGLMVGYVISAWRANRILLAALAAACVDMIGNYPLHVPGSGYLIVLIIALIEKEREERNEKEKNEKEKNAAAVAMCGFARRMSAERRG